MKKMNREFLKNLIRGASILACGGGVPYEEQRKKLDELCEDFDIEKLKLVDSKEVGKKDVFVTVAELGPADAPLVDRKNLKCLLDLFEEKTGKVVKGIIPGEIGQEVVTLEAGLILDLPIVDSDLAGCRAVPRLSDLAQLKGETEFTMSPLVICVGDGEAKFIVKQRSIDDDEKRLREIASGKKGETLVFLGGAVSGAEVKERLDYHSYTVAVGLGKKISSINRLASSLKNRVLLSPIKARIVAIEEKGISGFVGKHIYLESERGGFEIQVENEFMSLKGEGIRVGFPDLICLVDPHSLVGLSSAGLKKGQEVLLTIWERFSFWK